MAVTVTRTQTRSIDPGPLYKVIDTCTAALGFDTSIFVYRTAEETFSHVATTRDILSYPATKAAAVTAKSDYYRLPAVTFTSPSLRNAVVFAHDVTVRVQTLCNEFFSSQEAFLGNGEPLVITTTSQDISF